MADIKIRPGNRIGELVVKKLIPSWEKGGMAYVILVTDAAHPEKEYALKIAKNDKDGGPLNFNALLSEANLLKKLEHDGIVKLAPLPKTESEKARNKPDRYWGVANEIAGRPPYFLMEYLPGGTLTDVLNRSADKQVKFAQVLAFAAKLASALAYMHDQDYCHNDLKPNNIMFRTIPGGESLPSPILIDFGISTTKGASYLDGLTVHYAAPEKLIHAIESSYKPPDDSGWMKVDIWGLGVILYQILTREYPYHGKDPNSLITTIRTNRPEPISKFRTKLPKGLEEVILDGCLCFDIKNRLDASELSKQLEKMQ